MGGRHNRRGVSTMYVIIEWADNIGECFLVQAIDSCDCAGVATFKTEEQAKKFAQKHCKYNRQVVKIGE